MPRRRVYLSPYPTRPLESSMLAAIVRFIEELLDVLNFGSSINK